MLGLGEPPGFLDRNLSPMRVPDHSYEHDSHEWNLRKLVGPVVATRDGPREGAYLADFERTARAGIAPLRKRRRPLRDRSESGPPIVRCVRFPGRREEGFEVTAFDPMRRVGTQGTVSPFRARIRYVLEPMGQETTLTNSIEPAPSSAVSSLLAPLAIGRGKVAVASNLQMLMQVLQGDHPSRQPIPIRRGVLR